MGERKNHMKAGKTEGNRKNFYLTVITLIFSEIFFFNLLLCYRTVTVIILLLLRLLTVAALINLKSQAFTNPVSRIALKSNLDNPKHANSFDILGNSNHSVCGGREVSRRMTCFHFVFTLVSQKRKI